MNKDELIALLEVPDPLRAAGLIATAPGGSVTYQRGDTPGQWLHDAADESPIAVHRVAHNAQTPSVAIVRYGAGVPAAQTVDRLIALAELSAETGMLRAVMPVPAEGNDARPGSWGVEDLVVIAIARFLLPPTTAVRPDWVHLGPAACQIALAFGADDWQIPDNDSSDVAHLAAAVGRRAVPR
jgi:hypothetical protein